MRMARILVIDDEAAVRTMLDQILRAAGHEVALAADGGEGVVQQRAAPADLVLTDLVMASQQGLDTIIQLRREHPKVAIIAMSGKPAGGTLLDIAHRLGTSILTKPFSAQELLTAVRSALGAEPGPG
jgi:DNA-binding response OmpR family regulator